MSNGSTTSMKRMGALVGKFLPGIEKKPSWKQQTQINKQNQARYDKIREARKSKEITKEKKQMHGFGIDVGPIKTRYATGFGSGGVFG